MAKPASTSTSEGTSSAVAALRSLECIRTRCKAVLDLAKADKLQHFKLDESKLGAVVDYVKALMDKDYPDVSAVPFHSRWRHFEAGGIDRVTPVTESWACGPVEEARRLVDLAVVSVLLDAGAGIRWRYTEKGTTFKAGRSEGLGVASFHMFTKGAFSSDVVNPHRADAVALQGLADDAVKKAFQASNEAANPLVGCDGRTQVLKRLGAALLEHPEYFERNGISRPGNLVDYLLSQADSSKAVSVKVLWEVVMYGLESMWPQGDGRTVIDSKSMGDVWPHSGLPDDGSGYHSLIPFHKLSQWMTYSLMEPLQKAGIKLTECELMTGLPEYRNGGLLIDMGLLQPKYPEVTSKPHAPSEEVIVEWRALTVALLDEVHTALKAKLQSQMDFPLVKMLEAGTWKAGRAVAAVRDPQNCSPPISIISDGTVF